MGGRTKWKNPYITDGLVAMWDGEWNIGGGKHSNTATYWVNIVDGKLVPAVGTFGENYIDVVGNKVIIPTNFIPNVSIATIECCFENYQTSDNQNPALNYSFGGDAFGHIGAHKYSSIGGFMTRYGSRMNNLLTPVVNTNEFSMTDNYKASFSQIYDINNKRNNKVYTNGVYQTNFYYANELTLSGNLYMEQGSAGQSNIKSKYFSLRFYNRELSNEEISANYEIDKRRFGIK